MGGGERVDDDLGVGGGLVSGAGVGLDVGARLEVPAGSAQRQVDLRGVVVADLHPPVNGGDGEGVAGAQGVVRVELDLLGAVVVLREQAVAFEPDLQDVVVTVVDLGGDGFGFRVRQTGDRLGHRQGVHAAGVGPGGLLRAVHLPQLAARVAAVLGGDPVDRRGEHNTVAGRR